MTSIDIQILGIIGRMGAWWKGRMGRKGGIGEEFMGGLIRRSENVDDKGRLASTLIIL